MSEGRSVEELAAEFMERRQAGEAPDVEAFLAEHPEHAEEQPGEDLSGEALNTEGVLHCLVVQ